MHDPQSIDVHQDESIDERLVGIAGPDVVQIQVDKNQIQVIEHLVANQSKWLVANTDMELQFACGGDEVADSAGLSIKFERSRTSDGGLLSLSGFKWQELEKTMKSSCCKLGIPPDGVRKDLGALRLQNPERQ